MADIQTLLNNISKAVFGKDVRQSIHDAIKQCYYDGKAGAVDLEARENIDLANERIDNLAKLPDGSTTGDAELIDGRVDYNGNTHTNIGTHIREVSSQLSSEITQQQKQNDEQQEQLDILNQGGLNLKEDFIGKQVNSWLDDHPEATTTVKNASLNLQKFIPSIEKKIEDTIDSTLFDHFVLTKKPFGCTTFFHNEIFTAEKIRIDMNRIAKYYDHVIFSILLTWDSSNKKFTLPPNIDAQISTINEYTSQIKISGLKFGGTEGAIKANAVFSEVVAAYKNVIDEIILKIPFEYDAIWIFNESENFGYNKNKTELISFINYLKTTYNKKISVPMTTEFYPSEMDKEIIAAQDFISVNLYGNASPFGKNTTSDDIKDWFDSRVFPLTIIKKSKDIWITETGISSSYDMLANTGIYKQDKDGSVISKFYEGFYRSNMAKITSAVFWWYFGDAIDYAPQTLLAIKNGKAGL